MERDRMAAQVRLERVRRLALLWDRAIRIPILGRWLGVDALIGLVPVAGDLVGALVAVYPIVEAARLGAGPAVVGRMALNVAIDLAVGAIPLAGDLFDVAWQANWRNYQLLERWLARPSPAAAMIAAAE